MSEPRLPYGRQWIDDEDVDAVVRALRSDFLTQGPEVARFEAKLCEITGAKYAVAVANGTAALHLACLAAGVRAGDVGITATNTFVASANAIRYAGGGVRFADVDPATGLVTRATLEAACGSLAIHPVPGAQARTPRVIVPVDFAGAPAPLHEIADIAEATRAVVIEDAAHSLGATYTAGGQTYRAASCAHSHMATLSFHPVKHATTGEGGAVTTNDEALFRELQLLRTHGITKDASRLKKSDGPWYYEQHALGFNYRITDLQCALGTSQLGKLDTFLARRRAIAYMYDAHFAAQPFDSWLLPLESPAHASRVQSAHHLYVVRFGPRASSNGERADMRLRAYEMLKARGIDAQVHYIPVHTQPDFERAGFAGGSYPGADAYYAGALSLPMFPRMQDADVTRVVNAVRDVVESFS